MKKIGLFLTLLLGLYFSQAAEAQEVELNEFERSFQEMLLENPLILEELGLEAPVESEDDLVVAEPLQPPVEIPVQCDAREPYFKGVLDEQLNASWPGIAAKLPRLDDDAFAVREAATQEVLGDIVGQLNSQTVCNCIEYLEKAFIGNLQAAVNASQSEEQKARLLYIIELVRMATTYDDCYAYPIERIYDDLINMESAYDSLMFEFE